MTVRAWTHPPGGRWELRDTAGELVGHFSDEYVARVGRGLLNVQVARRGWPGVPWARPALAAVLTGGPQDGRWDYLDEDEPPAEIVVTWQGADLMLAPAGDGPADGPYELRPERYVLARQVCGHGRVCPYIYRWVP